MKWRLIEVRDNEAVETDLTDKELIGVGELMNANAGPVGVYADALDKLWPSVEVARQREYDFAEPYRTEAAGGEVGGEGIRFSGYGGRGMGPAGGGGQPGGN